MTEFTRSERNAVRRVARRARYDKETVYAIIDAAPICHVGFVEDGQPFVIPIIHARQGDTLYLHGAPSSRLLQHIESGQPVCVAVTLLDGLVLARSVFHHSLNYRSAVLFGRGHLLDDDADKLAALEVLTEHVAPGRWSEARQPNKKEIAATAVIALHIESASAKIRTGGPVDDEDDYALPIWAGILPLSVQAGTPVADARLATDTPLPGWLKNRVVE